VNFATYVATISEASGPWTSLGGGTTGSSGTPTLAGGGPLTSGSDVILSLTDAPPNEPTIMWISLTSSPQTFFGGTIHALPFVSQLFLGANTAGSIQIGGSWPNGIASGTEIWFQYLVRDPSVAWGITLSNAVHATTP
jgi:hypothetical protein